MECIEAGSVSYATALKWQQEMARKRAAGEIPDRLLLLEHPPVVTIGRRDSREDLRVTEAFLRRKGIALFKTDRGGRITYHGPGQLVGYLIFRIRRERIGRFVWRVEEVLIQLLKEYHLEAEREERYPGVWCHGKKIAALGLHVARGVTTHGFSLNVTCDLTPFDYIHPCGIQDRTVTSMERELGWRPPMRDVKHQLLRAASQIFGEVSLIGSVPTPPE